MVSHSPFARKNRGSGTQTGMDERKIISPSTVGWQRHTNGDFFSNAQAQTTDYSGSTRIL
jgi:hypothetical protein